MKAKLNDMEIEGTPAEIAEFMKTYTKKKYHVGGFSGVPKEAVVKMPKPDMYELNNIQKPRKNSKKAIWLNRRDKMVAILKASKRPMGLTHLCNAANIPYGGGNNDHYKRVLKGSKLVKIIRYSKTRVQYVHTSHLEGLTQTVTKKNTNGKKEVNPWMKFRSKRLPELLQEGYDFKQANKKLSQEWETLKATQSGKEEEVDKFTKTCKQYGMPASFIRQLLFPLKFGRVTKITKEDAGEKVFKKLKWCLISGGGKALEKELNLPGHLVVYDTCIRLEAD